MCYNHARSRYPSFVGGCDRALLVLRVDLRVMFIFIMCVDLVMV